MKVEEGKTMKVTEFGKFSRKLRIENDELLRDMANKLGVTASYLSAVEIGKRNIPKKWENIIVNAYQLDNSKALELRESIEYSIKVINIEVEQLNNEDKNLIFMLARKVNNLDEKDKNELREILFR